MEGEPMSLGSEDAWDQGFRLARIRDAVYGFRV